MPRTTDDIDIDNLSPVVRTIPPAENPFDLIQCPLGLMERWRANAMAMGTTGALSALHEVYQMVRNDAADVEARANEIEARKGLVQHLCDQIAGMQERINRLEDALEARRRADAERAARDEFEQEPLSLPPGDPPDPSMITADQHHPSGELHAVAPKGEGELPEPPLGSEDNIGDLPEELIDLPEPAPEPKGQVVQQPTALFGS
jgi:hypothetical protein